MSRVPGEESIVRERLDEAETVRGGNLLQAQDVDVFSPTEFRDGAPIAEVGALPSGDQVSTL